MRRILDEVPSSNIGVVLDPCNFIGDAVDVQDQIVDDSFRLFGDRIILAHLKDIYQEEKKHTTVRLVEGISTPKLS